MRCSIVDVNGISTRYFSAGDGPALLLLHGIGMGGDCFLRNFSELGRQFRVIAPDMLGHGATTLPDLEGIPPALAMARHVHALLRMLNVERAVVVGSSFGGLVAALLYLEQKSLVSRIVFAASGSAFSPPEAQANALRASMGNALGAMQEPSLDKLRQRLRNIVYDEGSVDEALLLSQLTTYAQPAVPKAYEKIILGTIACSADPTGQTAHRIADLDLPILMIAGCNDIRTPLASQERYVTASSTATLLRYEHCGHFPFLEHPSRFNADILRFAADNPAPPTLKRTS